MHLIFLRLLSSISSMRKLGSSLELKNVVSLPSQLLDLVLCFLSRDDSVNWCNKNGLLNVFLKSDAYNEYGIRLMLTPRSAKDRYLTEFTKDINEGRQGYAIFSLYALSGGGTDLSFLEEVGSSSFSASSASSSISS
ncbi:hypothetical protein Tco_0654764 [Tanacetum coccineum]|uniref:F-box domain-containing protein n=1 Tax=Tanacetum coccineum TaxID=301880 RepID=A0ABQ4X534_9ASTR